MSLNTLPPVKSSSTQEGCGGGGSVDYNSVYFSFNCFLVKCWILSPLQASRNLLMKESEKKHSHTSAV